MDLFTLSYLELYNDNITLRILTRIALLNMCQALHKVLYNQGISYPTKMAYEVGTIITSTELKEVKKLVEFHSFNNTELEFTASSV